MDDFLGAVATVVIALGIGVALGISRPTDLTAAELAKFSALCAPNEGLRHITVRMTNTVECNNGAEFRP